MIGLALLVSISSYAKIIEEVDENGIITKSWISADGVLWKNVIVGQNNTIWSHALPGYHLNCVSRPGDEKRICERDPVTHLLVGTEGGTIVDSDAVRECLKIGGRLPSITDLQKESNQTRYLLGIGADWGYALSSVEPNPEHSAGYGGYYVPARVLSIPREDASKVRCVAKE